MRNIGKINLDPWEKDDDDAWDTGENDDPNGPFGED